MKLKSYDKKIFIPRIFLTTLRMNKRQRGVPLFSNELFIPFLLVLADEVYENVYLHILKVLPILPCKRKLSYRKACNLRHQKQKRNLPIFLMSQALNKKKRQKE